MSRYSQVDRSRIRWHTRRGLLEMDLVLERFMAREFDQLSDEQIDAFVKLLELIDTEFLDLVNGKIELDDPALQPMIEMLRKA